MSQSKQQKETLFGKTQRVSSCRRRSGRQKLEHSKVVCWNHLNTPTNVAAIELDSRGARVVLPWDASESEWVHISIADQLGHHRTIAARVAWTQVLANSSNTICGLAFKDEVLLAA